MNKLLNILLFLCVTVILIGILPIHGEEAIYTDVIRLHVLAASDGEEDQELKLRVRDAVLTYTAELVADCPSKDDAEKMIGKHLDEIQRTAENAARVWGCYDKVSVLLGKESYPTRHYRSISLPSGEYTSLRVTIGSGEGQNWWCVLFPSLCLPVATDQSSVADLGFHGEQYRIITDSENRTYEVRFKILELFERISDQKE